MVRVVYRVLRRERAEQAHGVEPGRKSRPSTTVVQAPRTDRLGTVMPGFGACGTGQVLTKFGLASAESTLVLHKLCVGEICPRFDPTPAGFCQIWAAFNRTGGLDSNNVKLVLASVYQV